MEKPQEATEVPKPSKALSPEGQEHSWPHILPFGPRDLPSL